MKPQKTQSTNTIRYGEYARKGDYHKKIDKKWRYYPVYLAKMDLICKFLDNWPRNKPVLDVGCGEGILVRKYRSQGYTISGLDSNYQSIYVIKDDIRHTKLESSSYDLVLCLDVLEHLSYQDQEKAIAEIKRILKKNGIFVLAVPNLAHFASRLSFMFSGRLIRTSTIDRHIGDRPMVEYEDLLKRYFIIYKKRGIFPTFPIISLLTYYFPGKIMWLHKLVNKFFAYPNWCFLNIFFCKKQCLL
ncbi:MAG: hypothetical protein ACD_7C00210G0002 [uncultured bacterium]|nr:MAG: hypothetical protein ACD_7C00210G0002 [uncultured bacterium]